MIRNILERLGDETLVALRCRGSQWPHGLFAQTLIPDTWMGLVVGADGRRRLVPAGEDPRPDREDALVLVRNRPITVPLELARAPTASEHDISATVEMLVRIPAREDDLAALHRTLLEAKELPLDRLAEHAAAAGGTAVLKAFARERPAETLVHDDLRAALLTEVRQALKRWLLEAGLELEGLGRILFQSATLAQKEALERQTAREMQQIEARDMVERAARAATQRRLDDLGTIIAKLKEAAAGDASMRWHELLPALSPGERGRLLENLWRLTPDRAPLQAIVIVAGRRVAWLEAAAPDVIARQIELPDDLGGLRSVTYDSGGDELLVGAALGVWRLGAADGEPRGKYGVPNEERPRTGFNAAVIAGERIFGTHSQLGAWCWALDAPGDARSILRPEAGVPRTVRAATVEGERFLLAADDRVHMYDAEGAAVWQSPPASVALHCLAVLDDRLYAGAADGSLLTTRVATPDAWAVVHRALGPIESLQARRWDDLVELVIPAGRQGVCGVYGTEGIVACLLRAAFAVRRAWACDDAVVGLSEQRDRLVVLHGGAAERAALDVPIARVLSEAVQDLCLVVRREENGAGAQGGRSA